MQAGPSRLTADVNREIYEAGVWLSEDMPLCLVISHKFERNN